MSSWRPAAAPRLGREATDRRLAEAFGGDPGAISEMTAGNMVRLLKISEKDSEAIRREYGNSDVVPLLYAAWRRHVNTPDPSGEPPPSFFGEDGFDRFRMNFKSSIDRLVDFCKRFPKMTQKLGLHVDPRKAWEEAAGVLRSRGEMVDRDPVLRFPDGWYWVTVNDDECEVEGDLMQHCGVARGQMYSLRDPHGKPHVTLDLVGNNDSPGAPTNKVVQARGKQNVPPDRRYFPYVDGFLRKFDAFVLDSLARNAGLDQLGPWRLTKIGWERAPEKSVGPELTEMTVGNMVRLLGISQADAQKLHGAFGSSDIPARMWARYRPDSPTPGRFWYEDVDTFIEEQSEDLRRLIQYARRFPQLEKQISAAASVEDGLEIAGEFMARRGRTQRRGPSMTFPDGWYWVMLSDEECRIEGDLMQHCGKAQGQMYSLRDPQGRPHVTADVKRWSHEGIDPDELRDSPAPSNEVVQLRGKQNAIPDTRYWPYIEKFLDKFDAFVSDSESDELQDLSPWEMSGRTWRRTSVNEAPAKGGPTHLTAQRNIPREAVNAITSQPALRQTVWVLSSLPKGTQAARLMRYMEDKGWRQVEVAGRRLMYHARSFKLLEPVRPPREWTLNALYTMFRPVTADDGDFRRVDAGLVKLWGVRQLGDTDDIALSDSPSERFIRFISDPRQVEMASDLSDQLHQHTGIVLEPATARMRAGDPAARAGMPATQLPSGVSPDDVLVVAENGSMYVMLARDFVPGVAHDAPGVVDSGRARVEGPPVIPHMEPDPEDRAHVRGEGVLWRAHQRALSLGRRSVFLVARPARQVDTSPVPFRYSRGGSADEASRAARSIRETGGLPLPPGRWATDDLGRYVRMFRRDHGTTL